MPTESMTLPLEPPKPRCPARRGAAAVVVAALLAAPVATVRGVSAPAAPAGGQSAPADGGPAPVSPLQNAHAHNDYRHDRPLLDALEQGFTSVEADVFLIDGKLLVGHDRSELRPERTLEKLYLEPLRSRVAAHGGRVFPGGPEFTLLIDIKTEAAATYAALEQSLSGYETMLTTSRDGMETRGAVRAIVSGNRPRAAMEARRIRHAGYDGRLEDLDDPAPASFLPLVSDRWGKVFRWQGDGPMPAAERDRLRDIVRRAHARGRRVRFWATPERAAIWRELLAAGVDLINTDDLRGLRAFLLEAGPKTPGPAKTPESPSPGDDPPRAPAG